MNCGAPVEHDASFSEQEENSQSNNSAQENANAQQNTQFIPNRNAAPSTYIPPQMNYEMPRNIYVAPPKKENKVLVAFLIGLVALFVVGGVVSAVIRTYKSTFGNEYNQKEEESDTYSSVEETDSSEESDDNGGSVEYTAEDYTGPYDYFNGEWVVPVQGAFVSSSGQVNTEYLGEPMAIAQTTDLSGGMVLVNDGFRYINKEAADIEFAPNAVCADISPKGSSMFYLIPTGTKGDEEVGSLYVIDTDNGSSELIAENVVRSSPVISPSGKYVAYSRYTLEGFQLFIGGKDVKEEMIDIVLADPVCVSDDKQMFYINRTNSCFSGFDSALCFPLFDGAEITDTFISSDCKEIVATGKDGTYHYKFYTNDSYQKLSDSKLSGIITDCLTQPYGQVANTTYCDAPSLTDILFITKDKTIFAMNSDNSGITKLPRTYSDVSNIIMKSDGEKRSVFYASEGKFYRFDFDDKASVESIVYDDFEVDGFVSSYDLKKIWLISDGDIYYLEKDKATLVASGLPSYVDPLDDGIMWNVEDNWLYYLKGGKLWRVNTTEGSNQVVSKDANVLTNIYGKLYYLPEDRTEVYLFMDGEFKKVM
ncbi:hypothetical protein D6853_05070 [Butyrivibrio sp. X503]|nr:hypothetical protein D6853_05070 [Butyrivibrio sp. X503]